MKNLTWQNPEQLFVAQVLINKVKSKCCGIKVCYICIQQSLNTNKVTYDQQDYQQIYLAMGENIEVLEPKELRDKIADRLKNAVNRYK